MKEEYKELNMEIIHFNQEDVILTSNESDVSTPDYPI